jgi:GTP-binding protein
VDLPGYGYAKVAQSTQEKWSSLMETFFLDTERIHMGVLIVDLRHDPTDLDIMMSQFFRDANVPWMILANKSDKLKAREIEINVARTAQILAPDGDIPLFPFSAKTSDGKRAVLSHIML